MKFSKQFGNFIEDEVIKKLKYYGFTIDGYVEKEKVDTSIRVDISCREDIVQRALGLLFWELKQHEMSVMLQNGLD